MCDEFEFNHMKTFATTELENYNNIIEEIETEIQQLQMTLSQCQSERQNIQSIEQMGVSAIEQIMKTLAACNRSGLTGLADSFKQQAIAVLDDCNSTDDVKQLTAIDESGTDTNPSVPQAASDDEVLETIKSLGEEHLTDNYLPIFLYRAALPQLTRQQQDEALYRLEATDRVELSTLQEMRAYTPEQIKAGIQQDIGGRLFFIIVTEKRSPSTKTAVKRVPASVGAAAANDVSLMSFKELKTYCLGLGMNKNDIRKHGKLTRRDTWISALEDFS